MITQLVDDALGIIGACLSYYNWKAGKDGHGGVIEKWLGLPGAIVLNVGILILLIGGLATQNFVILRVGFVLNLIVAIDNFFNGDDDDDDDPPKRRRRVWVKNKLKKFALAGARG